MQRRRYALIKQPALENLSDTSITGAASGDVIYYDGTNWINTPYGELVDDRVSSLLVAGNNIDLTYDDGTNSLTVAVEALTAADITDFSEAVDDRLNALIVPGNNIDVTYDDALNTFTIDVEGLTSADISDFSEAVDDRVSSLLVAGNNIDLTYNDAGNTLTIDVEALTSADISDFSEAVDDRVGSLLVAGTNITLTYNDAGNALTIAAAGGTGAVATDAIWDAKGDLAVGTGADTASRLAVGTDGYVLTADSTQATGLKWAAAGSGSLALDDLTDVAITAPATGATLIYNGTGWVDGQLDLADTDAVTGTLAIANGGTGQTGATAAFDALAPTTTKGDLIAHNGTDNVRLAVGTDGYVLTADAAAAAGVKWAAAAASGSVATDTIWDAKGDLAVGTGSNTASRLAVGTDGLALIADSAEATGLKWAAAGAVNDGAFVYRNATAQTVATGTDTAVTFDTEERDDNGYATLGTNNTRLTAPATGWYVIGGTVEFSANATGQRQTWIRINGETTTRRSRLGYSMAAGISGVATRMSSHCVVYLSAGDYAELWVTQNSGSTLTLTLTTYGFPQFFIHRLGIGGNGASATRTGCRVTRSTNQTITTGAGQAVSFDTEDFDDAAYHDNSTNPTRLTIPTGGAGNYIITGALRWDSNTSGTRTLIVQKNGTTYLALEKFGPVAETRQSISTIAYLAAGDYVELIAQQDSGTSRTVTAETGMPNFCIHRL